MRHVAGGIDVNQEADAGDHHQHDDGQLVELQVETDAQIVVCHDPVEEFLAEGNLAAGEEFAHRFERAQERQSRRAESDRVYDLVGPL